jgi:hypothetical protein
MRRSHVLAALAAVLMIATGCFLSVGGSTQTSRNTRVGASVGFPVGGQPAPAMRDDGWKNLVDGNSLAAWRGYKTDTVPAGWSAKDGVLSKERPVRDIVTRDEYSDFELQLEWKITSGGNAGIFYRGTEEYDRIYWSAPEYQLLDDDNAPDGKNPLTRAATNYALYPRSAGTLKPVGEWNQTRILVKGAHVEHWLNGEKTVDYTLWSDDWKAKVAASKFKDWPHYGMSLKGRIALQGDHAGSLMFRNIKIREIK